MKNIKRVITALLLSSFVVAPTVCALPPEGSEAANNNAQIVSRIFEQESQAASICMLGSIIGSIAPMETWRANMISLFNQLPREEQVKSFCCIVLKRQGLSDSDIEGCINNLNISRCSAVSREAIPESGGRTVLRATLVFNSGINIPAMI